jgi:4-amino-4-deoxy-L-arabinose transferase-like glycosyltransferase
MNRTTTTLAVLLLLAATWLYARRLGSAPIYLSPDEAIISVDANALARTGRDVRGERLPLYFKIQMPGEERFGWFTPVIFYLSAAVMQARRFDEAGVRLPSVVIGLTDIVLLWLVARRLLKTERVALVAAALLVLTPAHFMLSRYALDYLYPAPFAVGWLLCVIAFLERGDERALLLGGFVLGVGFYTYISSVVMMPLYLGLTLAVVWHRRALRALLATLIGFAIPLLLFVPWIVQHPTAVADTAQRYALYDANRLTVFQGLRQYVAYSSLDRIASTYWRFFDPAFLFFTGDSQATFSTRKAGVFALPLLVLLPLGIAEIVRRHRTPAGLLVLAGFLTAPAAAVLVPEDVSIIRATALLPFGALIAAYGVVSLLRLGWSGRLTAAVLLGLVPIQFTMFARDYFGDYRVRSSPWLGGNLRGALEALIDRERLTAAPAVYFARIRSTAGLLDTRNRWMDAYWRFYLIKHHREDLLARSMPIDTTDVHWMMPGSLVLANEGDRVAAALVASGQLRRVTSIPEIGGEPFFLMLAR